MAIMQFPFGGKDLPCWGDEPEGECSLKALYRHLVQPTIGPHLPWYLFWKSQIPSKIKFFIWRTLLSRTPTCQNLYKKNITTSSYCPLCHADPRPWITYSVSAVLLSQSGTCSHPPLSNRPHCIIFRLVLVSFIKISTQDRHRSLTVGMEDEE